MTGSNRGIGAILRDGAAVAVTRGGLIAASFVSSIIVARALSVEERGRFGLLMAVAALGVQFGNLGLPVANTYLLARDESLKPALLGNTIRLLFGISVALALLVGWVAPRVPSWSALEPTDLVMVWFVAAAGIAQMFAQNILAGIFHFSASNKVDVLARIGAIVGMGAIWLWARPSAVSFAGLAAFFGLVATWWGLRAGRMPLAGSRWEPALARRQLQLGGRAYAACVASFALSRLPLYAVESRAGLEGLAYFTQALVIADTMLVVPASLGAVLFPSLVANEDGDERVRATWRLAGLTAALMAVGIALAAWLGPILLPLVYGRHYAASMPVLQAMFPGVLAYGLCSVMQNALSARGYPWAAVLSPLLGVVATLIGIHFASDPVGCGWAYSIGAATMLVASSAGWWMHRHRRPSLA